MCLTSESLYRGIKAVHTSEMVYIVPLFFYLTVPFIVF